MRRPPPRSTLFPYTTLFRSIGSSARERAAKTCVQALRRDRSESSRHDREQLQPRGADRRFRTNRRFVGSGQGRDQDRKSTRLNSSHMSISYAVFCLKKKKHK